MSSHKLTKVKEYNCECGEYFYTDDSPKGVCPWCKSSKDVEDMGFMDGVYIYRGNRVERDDSIPSGYYGKWQSGSLVCGTLGRIKEEIDASLLGVKA